LVSYATHVIADEEAASSQGGPRSLLDRLKEHGVWAAVTLGPRGVVTEERCTPAFRVAIKDTTGAGDVFHGAFALAIAEGRQEEESVRYASAAAASRCALGDVPHQKHIDRILRGLPLTAEEDTRGF